MSHPPIQNLPDDLLDLILGRLSRKDLINLRGTNRLFRVQVERYTQQTTEEVEYGGEVADVGEDVENDVRGLAHATQIEEEEEEARAAEMMAIERWDRTTLKSTVAALRKERDESVDSWCVDFVERRMVHVSKEDRALVSIRLLDSELQSRLKLML
jgi:hypothetical protein